MKKEIADEWIQELRSGKYKKATRKLRTRGNTFCCLGVLCNLASLKGVGEWDAVSGYQCGDDWALASPPVAVQAWAGMKSSLGNVHQSSLAQLNDDGWTFEEIADIIEENWETL